MTLLVKIAIPDSQRHPSKHCVIKYELDIHVYNFENWFSSIKDSLLKMCVSTAGKEL